MRLLTVLCTFLALQLNAICASAQQTDESITETIPRANVAEDDDTAEDESLEEDKVLEDVLREDVLVTGSRIKRSEFSTDNPIEIITIEKAALAGLMSTSEILQNSTVAAGQQIDDSFSGFVTDGGPGAGQISFRGLGGQRSLAIVNGKRWMPSGVRGSTNSVDLSAIPTSIISRYELLKDGASSIYGADAVAGVVNVITRSSADGFNFNMGVYAPQLGEGNEYSFDAAWGKTGAKWNIAFAAGITSQESLQQGDLDYAKCDTRPRLTDSDGNGVIDNRDPETGEELCFGFEYGYFSSGLGLLRYDRSLGNPSPDNPNYDELVNDPVLGLGIPYFTRVPTSDLDNASTFYRDTRSPAVEDIQTNSDIFSISSFGNYDFSIFEKSTRAYYELYLNRRTTKANNGYRRFSTFVPFGNHFNPFGEFGPLGQFGTGVTVFAPSYELDNAGTEVDLTRVQFFTGLKGDISSKWNYDAYFGMGYSDGRYRWDVFLEDRTIASLTTDVDVFGNVICADVVNFPDCIPINLFNEDALLRGRLADGATDFLLEETEGKTIYKGYTFSAYASGELFDLPAGTVSTVFGVEYRYEDMLDKPDEQAVSGNVFLSSQSLITKGHDSVSEFFTEWEVPLLRNLPAIDRMSLNVSGRFTNYDSFGSDTTYRSALTWQVFDSIRITGTHGTSFRAPALFEQHLGNQTAFLDNEVDPCKFYQQRFLPGDPVYTNCEAQNIPADYDANAGSIEIVIGGSDDLESEQATSSTLSLVYQPDALNFSLGITRYDIEIEDRISSLSAGLILFTCYESVDLTSPYCARVGDRDPQGNLGIVDSSFINIGRLTSGGYDINFLYEKEFPLFEFSYDLTLNYLTESESQLLGDSIDFVGHFGFPEYSAVMDFRIDWRNWIFNWRADFTGETEEEPLTDPPDRISETDNIFYHNLSVFYRGTHWVGRAVVINVLDEDPPLVSDGTGSPTAARFLNTLPGIYPLVGRSFLFSFGYNF